MANLNQLDTKKLRKVRVVSKLPGLDFINTAYLNDDTVWKVENGIVFVREISLTRHPDESFEPQWKPVIQQEKADKIIVYDWPSENELDRHDL